jgi:hypothetical protein
MRNGLGSVLDQQVVVFLIRRHEMHLRMGSFALWGSSLVPLHLCDQTMQSIG